MKPVALFLLLSLALLPVGCDAPPSADEGPVTTTSEPEFDPELAARLGADDYGMKSYVMAFLKAGPNRSPDSATAARLQRAHLDNITRMAEAGQLILAGPFLDDGDIRGIYIFDVPTVAEARKLTESDPAIQAGTLVMELHPWYGSATLQLMNDWHARVQKEKI